MQLTEEARIRLLIDGKEASNNLEVIGAKITDAKNKLKELEKGTQEYADKKKEIRELEKAYAEVQNRMDMSQMTVRQLEKYQKDLVKALKDTVQGTDDYVQTSEKLRQVNDVLAGIRQDAQSQQSVWANMKDWVMGAFSIAAIVQFGQEFWGFLRDSVKEFKTFEVAAQSLKGETQISGEALDYFKQQALLTGQQFGMTGEQMLQAYGAIASGKDELKEVKEDLKNVTDEAIKLALAGEMEVPDAAKVMVESLNQFKAGANDAAKFVDVLATGTIVGAGNIKEMGAALKYVGPVAKAAGLDFVETNAALQLLHQNGIKGEQAGTALRGMLAQLMKGADETNPAIVGLETALFNLQKMNLSAKDAVKIFGTEAVSAGLALVSGAATVKQWTAQIQAGGGAATMLADKTKTLEFQTKQAEVQMANLRVEVGSKLAPVWVDLFTMFVDVGVPVIQGLATAIITVVNILKETPKFIVENKEMFIALGVAIISLNGGLIVATASAIAHAAATRAQTIATNAAALAQTAMNFAMNANPIGLVISAVALLVGGFMTLYNKSETVRAVVGGLWEGFKALISVIWDISKAIVNLDFSGLWDKLKNGFTDVGKAAAKGYNDELAKGHKTAEDELAKANAKKKAAAGQAGTDAGKSEADRYRAEINKLLPGLEKDYAESVKKRMANANAEQLKALKIEAQNYGKSNLEAQEDLEKQNKRHRDKEERENRAAAKKRAEDEVKQNAEMLKDIDAAWADSIKDELQRNKVKLQQKYEQDVQAVDKSVASEKVKNAKIEALTKELIRNLTKLDEDHKKAQNEANEQLLEKIDAAWADSIKDELQRNKVKLQQKYEQEVQAIEKSKASEAVKNTWLKALYDKLIRDLEKSDKDYNDKRTANNEKALDEIAKLEAKGAKDKIALENAKYEAEKRRIEKLQIDEEIRLRLLKALEEEHIKVVDGLKVESADKEISKQKEKFSAISALMHGDLGEFIRIMGEKLDGVNIFKLKALEKWMEYFKGIAGLLSDGLAIFGEFYNQIEQIQLGKLTIKMNNLTKAQNDETEGLRRNLYDQEELINDYEYRIAQLRLAIYNEKDAARKADLQAELERLEREKEGVVLNKDVTTKEIEKIEREYAKKMARLKLEEWNRQKKLEIAMAVINGAQGFLKALASAPPPANFIMAGVTAAATAVQIGIIKSQVPPDFGDLDGVYIGGPDIGDSSGGGTVPDSGGDGGIDTGGGGRDNSGSEQSYGDGGVLTDDSYFVNNGVLGGLRHNTPEGGNWVINPRTGKLLAKVEAGEFMGVFSREVTKQHEPLLRRLANSSLVKTGKPVYAEQGYFGNLSDIQGSAAEASFLAEQATKDLNAINEQTAEMIEVIQEGTKVLLEMKDVLKDIAETSRITSEKELSVNIRNIIEVADEIADVSNQSSFG